MKKIISVLAVIFIIISCTAFCASAEVYTEKNMMINLPSNLIADSEYAAENEYTGFWYSEDGNFNFGTWTSVNDDNYTYVDYSEKDIQKLYKDYAGDDEAYCTLKKGENITVGDFEGVRLDIHIDDGQGTVVDHVVCAFSTDSTIYEFYFYIYDSSYMSYVDKILDATTIAGVAYKPEAEVNADAIAYIIVFVVLIPLFKFIKKKSDEKKAARAQAQQPVYYQPPVDNQVNGNTQNTVYSPRREYNPQPGYNPQPVAPENQYNTPSADNGFASAEAERERKEREKMFD